ncbi:MAG: hypothetical protein JRG96_20350 [Deltaproteobacteria bacterium]|nr:hypothetical protein [Deltaproteobacteria bacterium]MBW2420742.1 hypothetical protein [Deltaproteobacteria bacterium]
MAQAPSSEASPNPAPSRSCGACSLCCTVLRVDELHKLGGTPCPELRADSGCSIYAKRPRICRAYRCLWLEGGLQEGDRPDRLGAVVDLLHTGMGSRLSIQEAEAGAFDRSPRLQQIADAQRESMPVRIVEAGRVLDADRPFRVLLGDGEEHRVEGESIVVLHDGAQIEERRLPWLEARVRRLGLLYRRWRLRDFR